MGSQESRGGGLRLADRKTSASSWTTGGCWPSYVGNILDSAGKPNGGEECSHTNRSIITRVAVYFASDGM